MQARASLATREHLSSSLVTHPVQTASLAHSKTLLVRGCVHHVLQDRRHPLAATLQALACASWGLQGKTALMSRHALPARWARISLLLERVCRATRRFVTSDNSGSLVSNQQDRSTLCASNARRPTTLSSLLTVGFRTIARGSAQQAFWRIAGLASASDAPAARSTRECTRNHPHQGGRPPVSRARQAPNVTDRK